MELVALNIIIIITLNPTDPHHCNFKLTWKLHGLWLGLPSTLKKGWEVVVLPNTCKQTSILHIDVCVWVLRSNYHIFTNCLVTFFGWNLCEILLIGSSDIG